MDELSQSLKEIFDWTQYQASAYSALVKEGAMEASEIALRANIPNARVYSVLSALEKNGSVKKQGRRPALYDAQHPRKVIEQQQDYFNTKSEKVKSKLEEAFEVERDGVPTSGSQGWVMTSAPGVVNEIRNLWDSAEEEVLFVDSDIKWLSRKYIRELAEMVKNDIEVKAVGSPSALPELKDLSENGLKVKKYDEIERSFYVIDGVSVILRIRRGRTGIMFRDGGMATLFKREFNNIYDNGSEVNL